MMKRVLIGLFLLIFASNCYGINLEDVFVGAYDESNQALNVTVSGGALSPDTVVAETIVATTKLSADSTMTVSGDLSVWNTSTSAFEVRNNNGTTSVWKLATSTPQIDSTIEQMNYSSSTSANPFFTMTNTADDADSVYIRLESNRATPTNGDIAGTTQYRASDAVGTQTLVGTVFYFIDNTANGDEAGGMEIDILFDDGTPSTDTFLRMEGQSNAPGEGLITFNWDQKNIDVDFTSDDGTQVLKIDSGTNMATMSGDSAVWGTKILMPNMKSGTTQALAGAGAGELWVDTDDGNTIKLGT